MPKTYPNTGRQSVSLTLDFYSSKDNIVSVTLWIAQSLSDEYMTAILLLLSHEIETEPDIKVNVLV